MAGGEDAAENQDQHDHPGCHNSGGDRHRTQMEKRDATERRGHGAASRTLFITTKRAMSTPSAIVSSGNAPSRLVNVSTPPIKTKRPIIKAMVATRLPRPPNRQALHHRLRKYIIPSANPALKWAARPRSSTQAGSISNEGMLMRARRGEEVHMTRQYPEAAGGV